ncbi:MAG: VIT1/CCC1 transporter family protein [Ekhidna sp.]
MAINQHNETKIHGETNLLNRFQDYLGEFVYGGIDGSVTTFAVVAGASGANLESSIVIILGFANLIADGFAMSVGSYLSTKSEKQNYEKHEAIEYWEVENMPEKEREEIREIYEGKGFSGDLLDQVVDTITANKDRWVDVMMKEELEIMKESKSPLTMGMVTFLSFLLFGFIPLLIYVIDYASPQEGNLFLIASILTAICFISIGWMKSVVTSSSSIRGISETLILGAAAATLSYYVGSFLESVIS